MSLAIREATVDDIQGLCEVFLDAFSDYVIIQRIFPVDSRLARLYWLQTFRDGMQDSAAHFVVISDPSSPTPERLIAYAKWIACDSNPGLPGSKAKPQHPWPEGADTELATAFFGTMVAMHAEHMSDRPHWYLSNLAVRKESQRMGIGSKLVQWGLERADKAGVEAFLGSSPANAPLYRRYGFEDVDSAMFRGGYEHLYMRRKVSNSEFT